MIIAFIALTTTCNAGYQRPMEIQETHITEINAGPSGYRKPYDSMPQEMPPPPPPPAPSSYNRPPVEENFNQPPPQEPAFNQQPLPEQNFNQQPLPEQNFHQQPPMDMRHNSYMSSSMGFMNQGPMPYRSGGGYFRG
uniref:Extensin-like n=1 Tax=Strongyloides papillosus TaxID=174720 RepID=A0A0N5BCD9_STREA